MAGQNFLRIQKENQPNQNCRYVPQAPAHARALLAPWLGVVIDYLTVGEKKTDLAVMFSIFALVSVYFFNDFPVIALWS